MDTQATSADSQQLNVFWDTLKRVIPAPWVSQHYAESQSFVGVAFPIIDSVCQAMSSATVQIVKRKPKDAPAKQIRKAMSQAGSQESDESWVPIDETDEIFHDCKIFEQPNPRQSIGDINYEMTLQESLTGTSMSWKVPNGWGEPCEMYVIPTALTQALPMGYGSQEYPNGAYRVMPVNSFGPYAVMPSGSTAGAVIPAEQMAVQRRAHPLYMYDGYSPLRAIEIQRDVLAQIDQARWSSAANSVRPSVIITTPKGTTEPTILALQNRLRQMFAGAVNNGQPMILGAEMGAMPWGKSINEVGGDTVWEQLTSFLCAAYRVPKPIVGLHTTTTYAELFAALRQFYTGCLLPLCKRRGEFWTREILQPVWGDQYRVQLNPPKIDDAEELHKRNGVLMTGKALTKKELRASYSLPPFGDERDDEMAGDPSRTERELKEKEIDASKYRYRDRGEDNLEGGEDTLGNEDGPPRPVNDMGKGALGGSMQKAHQNGRESILKILNGTHTNGNGKVHSVRRAGFNESDHPRDDNGRFVSKEEMESAKGDPAKAKELLARVTDPEQRAKLEKELGQSSEGGSADRNGKQGQSPSNGTGNPAVTGNDLYVQDYKDYEQAYVDWEKKSQALESLSEALDPWENAEIWNPAGDTNSALEGIVNSSDIEEARSAFEEAKQSLEQDISPLVESLKELGVKDSAIDEAKQQIAKKILGGEKSESLLAKGEEYETKLRELVAKKDAEELLDYDQEAEVNFPYPDEPIEGEGEFAYPEAGKGSTPYPDEPIEGEGDFAYPAEPEQGSGDFAYPPEPMEGEGEFAYPPEPIDGKGEFAYPNVPEPESRDDPGYEQWVSDREEVDKNFMAAYSQWRNEANAIDESYEQAHGAWESEVEKQDAAYEKSKAEWDEEVEKIDQSFKKEYASWESEVEKINESEIAMVDSEYEAAHKKWEKETSKIDGQREKYVEKKQAELEKLDGEIEKTEGKRDAARDAVVKLFETDDGEIEKVVAKEFGKLEKQASRAIGDEPKEPDQNDSRYDEPEEEEVEEVEQQEEEEEEEEEEDTDTEEVDEEEKNRT